ncbi:CAP domain-containing protein [Streptomyces sp. NPDC090022]|uniref:CAP domain-containing protein n=1 Tax=Streptomyces sp. NPDC090022 TaxID=3365920 RepID=UPI003801B9BE
MHKHRKKTPYKKMTIAAVTLGVVGIPTAAMACWDTQGSGAAQADRQRVRPTHSAPFPAASLLSVAGDAQTPAATATPTAPGAPGEPTAPATPSASAEPAGQDAPAPQETRPATPAAEPPTEAEPPAADRPARPAPARPAPPVVTQPPTAPASGPAAEVVALVNKERAKAGCSALTVNAKLTAAAQGHSQDMAAHSTMSHTGSDGSDPGRRITRAGYTWSTYGENVAYGYSSPEQVMTGWMNSPGHRQNILNCSFKEIGVGLAQPNSYWTQAFAAAR